MKTNALVFNKHSVSIPEAPVVEFRGYCSCLQSKLSVSIPEADVEEFTDSGVLVFRLNLASGEEFRATTLQNRLAVDHQNVDHPKDITQVNYC